MKKALGGYFEFDICGNQEFYPDALRLNSGRSCLAYILEANGYRKVYLPYYTCEVLLEPIKRLDLDFEFYSLDEQMFPVEKIQLKDDEVMLYVNYFGLYSENARRLSLIFGSNLIIDNSQALYSVPIKGVDTFYSPRKFFGLPDGGLLFSSLRIDRFLDQDVSYHRASHLFKRLEESPESGYQDFVQNDRDLSDSGMKRMSKLTEMMFKALDFNGAREIRRKNFEVYHASLKVRNRLSLNFSEDEVPMVYPFFVENGRDLKKKLIENRVFVATYWSNIEVFLDPAQLEMELVRDLIPLPLDQRIEQQDVRLILELLDS